MWARSASRSVAELKKRVREADLILALGPRLGEMTTGGYTLFDIPRPGSAFVHVHPGCRGAGPRVPGRPDDQCGHGRVRRQAARQLRRRLRPSVAGSGAQTLRSEYLQDHRSGLAPGALNLSEASPGCASRLPAGRIITNGAGNFSGWVQRFYQYTGFRTQLAPTNGAMGYGVPAAVAAKLVHPDRMVVCFSGDGDFLMTGQELATAVQYGAAVIFWWSTTACTELSACIRSATIPPGYMAQRCRTRISLPWREPTERYGELVERTEDFAPAFERAAAAGKPAVIELRIDPEAITTRTTLTAIREQALYASQ